MTARDRRGFGQQRPEPARDPETDSNARSEPGAVAGAIAGTSLIGPLGGMEGAIAGGEAGATIDDEPDAPDARLETGEHEAPDRR